LIISNEGDDAVG